MEFMKWSNALATGLPDIDRQHHWLLDATNQLYTELSQSLPNRDVIAETLNGLMDYTMNHFVAEESLFQRIRYPYAVAHKIAHDRFTAHLMQLIHEHEAGKDIGAETLEFLKDWLIHHIMQVDKAYVPFVPSGMVLP